MGKENLYTTGAKYYDLLVVKKDIQKEIEFLGKVFKKFHVKSVLDVGCGTGLHLIPLKRLKYNAEGLDLSTNMLKEAKKKNKNIKLYPQDMSNFSINKQYSAIICLSSTLISVPNFTLVKKTLKRMYIHLKPRGILLLDLPNHAKEIKEQHNVREAVSHKLPKGKVDFLFFSYKQGNKWVEEWDAKEDNKTFKCIWKEFIYNPKTLESYLRKIALKIVTIYGSMTGKPFKKNISYRRIYLCQK